MEKVTAESSKMSEKMTEESLDAPRPFSTSSFTLHYSAAPTHVHSAEWKVWIYTVPPFSARMGKSFVHLQKSPAFYVLGNKYYLELLICPDNHIKLKLFHSGCFPNAFPVTAEFMGEKGVLSVVPGYGAASRTVVRSFIFDFPSTNLKNLNAGDQLHFIVSFQDVEDDSQSFQNFDSPINMRSSLPGTSVDPIIRFPRRYKIKELRPPKEPDRAGNRATHRMSYQNSSVCLKNLSADLLRLYENTSNHDVKLLCDGQTTSAHRSILSARSEIFRDKLQSEDYQNGCLEVKDVSFPVLLDLLRYIYTGILQNLTEESASELSEVADKYAIRALKERITNYLQNPLSSYNDCNCLQSLSVDLHELYKDESSHDVKLRCGEESASAHGYILSARSSVFKNILLKNQSDSVEVEGMDFDVFQQLLSYIYTGVLPAMTKELAGELLKAAGRYDIRALWTRCNNHLMELIDPSNPCDMLPLADALGDKDFKLSVISSIIQARIPFNEDSWKPFCDAHPQLAHDVINRLLKKLDNIYTQI